MLEKEIKKEELEIVQIHLDESGAAHHKETKWFVIAGIIVLNENDKSVKAFKKFEKKHNKNLDKELKARDCSTSAKEELWDIFHDKKIKKIAIVFDKTKNKFREQESTKKKENVIFNYLIGIMFEKIISSINTVAYYKGKNVNIVLNCDNRATGVKQMQDLETYLTMKLIELQSKIGFKINKVYVNYYDSKYNPKIRIADFVAHIIYCCHYDKNHKKKLSDNFVKKVLNSSTLFILHYFPDKKNSPLQTKRTIA